MGKRLLKFVVLLQLAAVIVMIGGEVILWTPMRHTQNHEAYLYRESGMLDQLTVALTDEETGQRGFDLTGDVTLLSPFTAGTQQFNEVASELMTLTAADSALHASVEKIIATGRLWHTEYGQPQVEKRWEHQPLTDEELLQGRGVFQRFRDQVRQVKAWTDEQLEADQNRLQALRTITLYVTVGIVGLTMLILTILLIHQLRSWIRPINRLTTVVNGYSEGELAVPVPELEERSELGGLFAGIESMRKSLLASFHSMQMDALSDGLTGIGNRRYFDGQLGQAVSMAQLDGREFCVLLCDIDHFKSLNDTFGHQVGDLVLQVVRDADRALYAAKENGRDLVWVNSSVNGFG
ncbi:diguanylate cyclase [Alicyclobacillus fastidiosus]|uniref:Diguanylate cyclase n=1 Tax=Alicyclobacillus fastidiosus TaxID=392011 RepID=A0ABV5AL42_9BACL|nr:diguanylate cyclase [Alicyclobacillus fastidiosus]WEH08869.1 diguanylate cyclase [Alicyclobacillus fastidiosus]